jgi:metal-responsive CopG/Arc/MetJ family transcriptional regulator
MTQDTILHMRVAEEIRAKLDDLRRAEPDLPSRSEMVRRLIEEAHKQAKGKRK